MRQESLKCACYGGPDGFVFVRLPIVDRPDSQGALETATASNYVHWYTLSYSAGRFRHTMEAAGKAAGPDVMVSAATTFAFIVVGMIEKNELPPLHPDVLRAVEEVQAKWN